MENIKFLVTGNVKAPTRRAGQDAGVDLYVPELSEQFIKDLAEKNPNQPFTWGLLTVPEVDEQEKKVNERIVIYVAPQCDILIPTYVKSRIPSNYCLRMSNKSGVCTRQKLMVGAEIIDSSYEGIIYLHLWNPSNTNRFIEFGQKIAQVIPMQINDKEIEVSYTEGFAPEGTAPITEEKFYEGMNSERGEGAFGSTGN